MISIWENIFTKSRVKFTFTVLGIKETYVGLKKIMIMRNGLKIMSVVVVSVALFSCQKNDQASRDLLNTDLATSVAEIVGTQVGNITGAIEQGAAVEKYDGHSPAYVIGMSGVNLGLPANLGSGIGKFRFGIPHIDKCATVTVSSTTFPKEITIEYPSTCTDPRGHAKQGKIIISLSDTMTNDGAVQTIQYIDFIIDSLEIDMTGTVRNLGLNEAGNRVIEKTYSQTLTKGDQVIVRDNFETEEWLAGFGTADHRDNIKSVTGNGTVKTNGTVTYSRTITTALLIDGSCEFIKSGVVELNRDGVVSVIDYGDGTCDNKATITTDGTTEDVNLRSGKFNNNGRFHKHFNGLGEKPGAGR